MGRSCWLDLFTGTTWEEFLAAGGTVSGFRRSRWSRVQKIAVGDWFLCYVTGVSRWIGILEVTGEPFLDDEPIWTGDTFPARLPVKVVTKLSPEHAVPVQLLGSQLSYFQTESPYAWTGHFRTSPLRERADNAAVVVAAIQEAAEHPESRPYAEAQWKRRVRTVEAPTDEDEVTIPEEVPEEAAVDTPTTESHDEIEWLLLKLGSDMGFDVWLAKADRGKSFSGQVLGEMPRMLDTLPAHFDSNTNKTFERIDVLWVQGPAFFAAFEVEHTTQVFSGLLRLADLVCLQPGINIRLNIVAPDARRDKVLEEITRPVFSSMRPPLSERCQFIPYSELKGIEERFRGVTHRLRPDILDDIAESAV